MIEKDMVGFEQYYTIYENGDIYSKEYSVSKGKKTIVKNKQKINPFSNGVGYLQVNLFNGEKMVKKYVHRMVAITFLGDKSNMEVNHIDGDKTNNNLWNLEWVTHRENMQHAVDTGLFIPNRTRTINKHEVKCKLCGSPHYNESFCSEECVRAHQSKHIPPKHEILDMMKRFKNFTYVAKLYNVSDNGVKKWCKKYSLPIKIKEWKTM